MRGLSLQFITHYNDRYDYLDSVRMALAGGCRWIQLRMKGADDDDFMAAACEVRALCHAAGARFVIDDRAHLVDAAGADGVHLGKSDMPVADARRLLGSSRIIGGTANTIDDVVALCKAGVDYIGCGPFRFTTTKERLSPCLGLAGYADIVSAMCRHGLRTPLVAIGGITLGDIDDLAATGVDGIALSGAVLSAGDPVAEMRRIVEKCNNQQNR